MIYEDKDGNFLAEEDVNRLDVSRIIELGIHAFDTDDVVSALRG